MEPEFVRFSYSNSRPKLVSRRRFMMHMGSRGGFTAFAHFQRPHKADVTMIGRLFACSNLVLLQIWITSGGQLKAQLKTPLGTVTSTSSRAVADDTDELFAIQYSTAASTLTLLWGPSAENVTVVNNQVRQPRVMQSDARRAAFRSTAKARST